MGGEEGRDQHGLEHSREHCNDRDEKARQVRHSGRCDDQDAPEEGDQGWEARGLRQNRHGEGEAGQDRRQGFPREGTQGRVLRVSWSGGEPCDEAPRVLLHFPPLAPLPPPAPPPRPPPSSRRFYSLLLLSRLAGGCVVKHGLPVPGRLARAITCIPPLSRRAKK